MAKGDHRQVDIFLNHHNHYFTESALIIASTNSLTTSASESVSKSQIDYSSSKTSPQISNFLTSQMPIYASYNNFCHGNWQRPLHREKLREQARSWGSTICKVVCGI